MKAITIFGVMVFMLERFLKVETIFGVSTFKKRSCINKRIETTLQYI